MREIEFRAWAEHTIDNKWNYAWDKSEEVFSKTEPSKQTNEWSQWYDERGNYRDKLIAEWDESHTKEDRYSRENIMITNIMVNGKVQRPYGHEIIDVMEYIGLNDNKGQKIFEGDVIQIDEYSYEEPEFTYIGEVIYSKNNCCFSLLGCESSESKKQIYPLYDLQGSYKTIINVIGNKHQNPELLESKEK